MTEKHMGAVRRKRNLYAALAGFTASALLFGMFFWGAASVQRGEVLGAQVVDEQIEKKELAKEAQQALCGTKDTEIFDPALCLKLAEAAQEPIAKPSEAPAPILRPSQAELVAAFRLYCAEGNNCRGADGAEPSANDIATAFVQFCSDGRCNGPVGEKGKDAVPPEPLAPEYSMVLAAVQDVCANDACQGPAGINGANATQEMVLAAVQTVCANEACRGAKGDTGDKGDKGDAPTVIHMVDPAGRPMTCAPNPPGSTEFYCTYDEKPGPTLPPIETPIIGGTP